MGTVLYLCGLITATICLCCYTLFPQKAAKVRVSNMDDWRKKCRDEGLVLHLPSYHNGIEAYVPKGMEHTDFWSYVENGLIERY